MVDALSNGRPFVLMNTILMLLVDFESPSIGVLEILRLRCLAPEQRQPSRPRSCRISLGLGFRFHVLLLATPEGAAVGAGGQACRLTYIRQPVRPRLRRGSPF